jgi:hypothetical protein
MTRREWNDQRLQHLRSQAEALANGTEEEQEHAYEMRCEADELEHYMGLDSMEEA